MTSPTVPWNIPLFAAGDTIPSLEAVLNSQSNAMNTALNTMQLTSYLEYGTRSAMNAVPGTVANQHATVNADSTVANNGDYYWSGSAWVATPYSGMTPIKPTTASGGTVGANGVVTFSSTGSVSVNGCFTTAYDNYHIVLTITAASVALQVNLTLRNGGVDLSGSPYSYGFNELGYSAASTTPTGVAGGANIPIVRIGSTTGGGSSVLDIIAPALTQNKFVVFNSAAADRSRVGGGTAQTSTSCDGFTITAGGTITGSLRIYAITNN